jgi:hypothetical protein
MSYQKTILLGACFSTLLPVVAAFLRGRSRRIVTVATVLTAAAVSLHLGILVRLYELGPVPSARPWVYALVISTLPLLLAGLVLSLSFGRDHPEESLRDSRRTLLYAGFFGVVLLSLIRQGSFISGYGWEDGRGTVLFGALGKAYLSYLLIGIVAVGYNLEKTYRLAPIEGRYRIRLPLLGFFSLLGFLTFILATGMLYSGIGTGRLLVAGLPVMFASISLAYGYLRGAITDVAAPVSRKIVYSSFTAVAAALFVLAIGLAAQVAAVTRWSPDEILIVSAGFLAILVAGLLLFSNRFQRGVRRYIDRNFYVNRYDYRTQWSRLTESLESVTDRENALDRVATFLKDVFAADDVTIALRDEAARAIRPVRGLGTGVPAGVLELDSPLSRLLSQERRALLLDRKPHDFTYIPIYAENQGWLDATASQIVAPLPDGGGLVGTLGLARKTKDDPFTYEDVELLDRIAAHVASTIRSLRLAQELSETREVELMSQWSSMLLHDLKNYLAPMRMVATNLEELKDRPDIGLICARDLNLVTDRMERLVHALSDLRNSPSLRMEAVCVDRLVQETICDMQIARRPSIKLELGLEAECPVQGDRAMLRRVLENLITNAIESMDGGGVLSIKTDVHRSNGHLRVCIGIADTGEGMDEGFLREKLFRPFSTTKKRGLGLGLYQCRSIVQAHGGELSVQSRVGVGTVFEISLNASKEEPQTKRIAVGGSESEGAARRRA